MSSFDVFKISGSGMTAQNLRLNLVASNLANVDAISSSIKETYKARMPVFRAMFEDANKSAQATGVNMVGVLESKAPMIQEYAPHHPMANEQGYVFRPNINVMEEMANMISASRAYQNNVEVVNSARQMMTATINLGR